MKPYVFPAIGAAWLIFCNRPLQDGDPVIVVGWPRVDPAFLLNLFRVLIPLVSLGWIAPRRVWLVATGEKLSHRTDEDRPRRGHEWPRRNRTRA